MNNFQDLTLVTGDKLLIINNRVNGKLLTNVELNEIITITSISDDYKIIYHHNSLALPNNKNIFKKLNGNTIIKER